MSNAPSGDAGPSSQPAPPMGTGENAVAGPSTTPLPSSLATALASAGAGDEGGMFDPATLANIAALSQLMGDAGGDGDGDADEEGDGEDDGEGDGGDGDGDGEGDGEGDQLDIARRIPQEKWQAVLDSLRGGSMGSETPADTEGEEEETPPEKDETPAQKPADASEKSTAPPPSHPPPVAASATTTVPETLASAVAGPSSSAEPRKDEPRGKKRDREDDDAPPSSDGPGPDSSNDTQSGPKSADQDKQKPDAGDKDTGDASGEAKVEEDELRETDAEAGDTDANKTGDEGSKTPAVPEKPKKAKSKRNRLVLSCTECHRRKQLCDRNIPCSRCIRRGVASMCRMEHPVLPQRKKRKVVDASPVKHELGLRVAALEALIRSGSAAELEQAGETLTETVRQATRAAGMGSLQASQALANLSNAAKGDLGPSDQAALLMNVLQQLAAASSGFVQGGTEEVQRDIWGTVPDAIGDTFESIQAAYDADTEPSKIILTLPGFREDSFAGFTPPTAKFAATVLRRKPDLFATPLPIQGYEPFLTEATKLAYGADTVQYKKGNIAALQATSMIGALRIAATFISRFPPLATSRIIYVPGPTLEDHEQVLQEAGLEIEAFRYLDENNGGIDWQSIREDLQKAIPGSAVLLFVSGSIPTGADLTPSQWRLLSAIIHERHLIPLCVMSFQGLATGDLAKDAQPVRFMVHEGLPVVLVQDFEATMGLYNDSPGVVSVVCGNHEIRDRINGQLQSIAKGFDSKPSPWGAGIAHMVLTDPKLSQNWTLEIKAMSDRLRSVRDKLYDTLVNKKETPGEWAYIKKATGMFCTVMLSDSRVEALTTDRHVHLLPDGSFSLGCLNAVRIESFASSIDYSVREGIKLAEEAHAAAVAMEAALRAAQEAAAREVAEAEERAAREAEEAALAEEERLREEDQRLMEASIANAIEAQRRAEEEAMMQEEERREMDEAIRKAAEKAEIARRAEEILASIGLN